MSKSDLASLGIGYVSEEVDMENITVVRVSTSKWVSNGSINYKRTLKRLARKSKGYSNIEVISEADETEEIGRIVNLLEVPDGVYYLETFNEYTDWETGAVDDWDYVLTPYK